MTEVPKYRMTKEEEAELPALFWDSLPDDPDNPQLAAIEALKAESTPWELADNYKTVGNEKLKQGLNVKKKWLIREAVLQYDDGLKQALTDSEEDIQLKAALYNNRAQAQLHLKNYQHVISDCNQVLLLQPDNAKALFRSSKACLESGQWDECLSYSSQLLKLQPENQDAAKLQKECQSRKSKIEQQQAQLAAKRAAHQSQFVTLASAVEQRGYKLTAPQFQGQDSKPYLDSNGCMHWPVTLMYPEQMTTDHIQDIHENDVIGEHLDEIFCGDQGGPEWDSKGDYTREKLQLYYLTNAGVPVKKEELVDALQGKWPETYSENKSEPKRYGNRAAEWKQVNQKHSLQQILGQKDFVIPGIPIFFVVSKGSEYEKKFLENMNR